LDDSESGKPKKEDSKVADKPAEAPKEKTAAAADAKETPPKTKGIRHF